ncbi:MAG: Type 1 glutamine amidotransferase-like domain-containing protein [Clostridia bacterium]|nr:Type 1 glutamine amidotransferase-like domain-containing protein [Clostridia bacterium]
MDKIIVAIGGGSLKEKTTAKIDAYIASLAKKRAGERRAVGLFIGTASHDSMPYFNTFRKTYTSDYDIKADCVLSVYGEMNDEKIKSKFEKADLIYIGGGDTLFMLEFWQKKELLNQVIEAYNRGVIIAGLSAGAICWFEKMYTDSQYFNGENDFSYSIHHGLKHIKGICCPHFNEREQDFCNEFANSDLKLGWGIENDCAIEFVNGEFSKTISAGGKAYKFLKNDENIKKILL